MPKPDLTWPSKRALLGAGNEIRRAIIVPRANPHLFCGVQLLVRKSVRDPEDMSVQGGLHFLSKSCAGRIFRHCGKSCRSSAAAKQEMSAVFVHGQMVADGHPIRSHTIRT